MNILTRLIPLGLLLLLSIHITACQAPADSPPKDDPELSTHGFDPKAPTWFKTGKAIEASDPFTIAGLGFSAPNQTRDMAFDQARKAALEAIADQIETRINSEKTLITESLYLDGEYSDKEYFEGITKQWTHELLVGVVIKREYFDVPTGTAGAVGVMDRQVFSKRMYQMAEEKHTEAQGKIAAFEQAKEKGLLVQALKDLIQAHGALEEISKFHSKVIAVGDDGTKSEMRSLNDPALKERLTTELTLLGDLKTRIVSGDEQKANLSGVLPASVVVKVMDPKGNALPGLAMKIMDPPDKEMHSRTLATAITSQDGTVSFQISGLKSTSKHSNAMTVSIDFNAYADKTLLKAPLNSVTYFWPTREITRVAVIMHETIDGGAVPTPFTTSVLEDELAELGFQVVRLNQKVPPQDAVKMTPAALAQKLGGECEYVLIGQAEAFLSSEISNQVFYRTRGSVDALELGTGKVFHLEIPFQATKEGTLASKKKQAAYQSLKTAGKLLMEKLSEKFISRFENGADWDV